MTKLEPAMRQYALDTLYNWYNETDNPLYVWEALSVCLSDDERLDLPDWCLHYLRSAAGNLYKLSRGFDFRSPASGGHSRKNLVRQSSQVGLECSVTFQAREEERVRFTVARP